MGGSFACVWWFKHTIPKGCRLFYTRSLTRGYPRVRDIPLLPKCCFSDLKTGLF
jgi:hypothetical protein